MNARRLMVLGTGSDVGKSLLVAGLCRAYARRGLKVVPFKAQNMSNNAAVTPDGGEIGRAQALQAWAAGVPLSVDMNPVLLKPDSDIDCQVVVQGRVLGRYSASAYQMLKPSLRGPVAESLARLSQGRDLVLIEGAGSGAERYLRPQDISNMGLAESADLPVVLLADESRGGVTAAVLGHHLIWTPDERARIAGVIVTKFRGDPAVFAPAAQEIEAATGWPLLGLLRWSEAARLLPAEDSLGLPKWRSGGVLVIAVPCHSRIANFDDLDPLAAEAAVTLRWVLPGEPIPRADVVLLPGSKSTRAALEVLRAEGWDIDIRAHVRRGGRLVGLCAGFQMLGHMVRDPEGLEGPSGETEGLGLLDIETVIGPQKRLRTIGATDAVSGARVTGYEMHMGATSGAGLARPWLRLDGLAEGATSPDGRVTGSYLHGLFASDSFRHHWLGQFGVDSGLRYQRQVEDALDRLAAEIEADMDLDALLALAH